MNPLDISVNGILKSHLSRSFLLVSLMFEYLKTKPVKDKRFVVDMSTSSNPTIGNYNPVLEMGF